MRAHTSVSVGCMTSSDTIWVRRPTAPPAGDVSAATYRLDRPVDRPHDRAAHRPRLALVAAHREPVGRVPPARRRDHDRGGDRRADRPDPASSDRKHIDELAVSVDAAIVGLGTCGSCTTFTIKDSVAIEAARTAGGGRGVRGVRSCTHTTSPATWATATSRCSCCRTRSRPGPPTSCDAIADRVLPEGARAARGHGVTAHHRSGQRAVEIPADPARAVRARDRGALERRRAAAAGYRRCGRRACSRALRIRRIT